MKKLIFILVIITSNINTVNSQSWQWARRCGSDEENVLNNIVVDNAGNTYSLLTLGGLSKRVLATSNNIPADDIDITRYGAKDAIIVSYDKCGKLRWHKVIGSAGNEWGVNIGIDSSANIYTSIFTNFINTHISTDTLITNTVGKTITLVKYDSSGHYKWAKQANPDTVSSSNNYYFRVYASTTTKEGDSYLFCNMGTGLVSGSTNLVSTQKGYYVLKYNSSGIPKELTKLDITFDEELYLSPELLRFHRTNSGKYILSVIALDYFYTTSPSYFGNQKVNTTAVIGCFDKNGSFLWKINNADSAKYAGGLTYWDENRRLIYIGGNAEIGESYLSHLITNKASYHAKSVSFVACVDTLGNNIWLKQSYQTAVLNGAGSGFVSGVMTPNGKFVCAGNTQGMVDWGGYQYDSRGVSQGFVAAFDANNGDIFSLDSLRDKGGSSSSVAYAADNNNNVYVKVNYKDHLFVGSQDIYTTSSLGGMCIAKWGFADCTVTPLKFLEYSVTNNNNRINNTWSTANEINVSRFNVQRSINGKDFITIGKVEANNKTSNEYRYTDNRLPLTVDGKLYYRIVGVDDDGKLLYSEVRQVAMSKEQLAIGIFPNPAKDVVHIVGSNIKEVKVINYLGQEIASYLAMTSNDPIIINTKNLSKGLYIVQIITKNNQVKNEKLIVQ